MDMECVEREFQARSRKHGSNERTKRLRLATRCQQFTYVPCIAVLSALCFGYPLAFTVSQRTSKSISGGSLTSPGKTVAASSEQVRDYIQAGWIGIVEEPDLTIGDSAVLNELDQRFCVSEGLGVFPHSETQLKSIRCDASAVLLKSGPGTGKTFALASRIAYLIETNSCGPENMVVLSFTNRDARNLKHRAMEMMFGGNSTRSKASGLTEDQVRDRLWSGTIHSFASSLVNAYGTCRRKLRILSSKESRMRVDKCLHSLLDGTNSKEDIDRLNTIRRIHRDALSDLRQSRGMAMHQIGRCIELWKESGILQPPAVQGVKIEKECDARCRQVKSDNCIELAMRLGISVSVAKLAWEVYPEYQIMHEIHGTADPADIASLAYHLLLSSPKRLEAIRAKLKHVILDEYQDVSVSQHALIRLVIRGRVDDQGGDYASPISAENGVPPVLAARKAASVRPKPQLSFNVPKLFCCGDPNQSIYGWRGAAPSISVDGFRKDYPQGVVIPLDTSFRLSRDMWKTANILADADNFSSDTIVQTNSPVGRHRQVEFLTSNVGLPRTETLPMLMEADPLDEITANVNIRGIWDSREEAKFIVTRIRKRSRMRVKRVAGALKAAMGIEGTGENIADPSEVAIITRSANYFVLISEALESGGVPYVVYSSEYDDQKPRPVHQSKSIMQTNRMKPVALMTMHRAKGEEFDEIYLPGWSEGEFPHPTAVSSNRVDEERRLAYVAISRARNHVMITHSFVRRDMHYGPDLMQKLVTLQIKPSRFLYELVPDAQKYANEIVTNSHFFKDNRLITNVPCVVWNRGRGSKEMISGGNLPSHFANSYKVPKNYERPQEKGTTCAIEVSQPKANETLEAETDEVLSKVIHGLNQLIQGVRGAKTIYKREFMSLLKGRFNDTRGTAPIFNGEWTLENSNLTKKSLADIVAKPSSRKAVSQCSAVQLGLYLASKLLL